jgi:hypothetical protein
LFLRFDIYTTVTTKNAALWDMKMPCTYCKNRRFGETYCLHLQGEILGSLCSQRGCTSRQTGQRDSSIGMSTVTSMCYRGDVVDQLLLCRMWWLASHRGQQCKIWCFQGCLPVCREIRPRCETRGLKSSHPEDEGDMFLRNVGYYKNYMASLYPRRQNSSLFWFVLFNVDHYSSHHKAIGIWGCHSGSYESCLLLGYSAVRSVYQPTFWRNLRSNLVHADFLLGWFSTLNIQVKPSYETSVHIGPHGVISQMMATLSNSVWEVKSAYRRCEHREYVLHR